MAELPDRPACVRAGEQIEARRLYVCMTRAARENKYCQRQWSPK
jgi:hypothetical protein